MTARAGAARPLPFRLPLVRAGRQPGRLLRVMRGLAIRRLLVLWVILLGVSIVHVWVRLQVLHVGYDLSTVRQVGVRLENEQRELEVELATLRDPGRIADVARRRLGMIDPIPGQVVVLP